MPRKEKCIEKFDIRWKQQEIWRLCSRTDRKLLSVWTIVLLLGYFRASLALFFRSIIKDSSNHVILEESGLHRVSTVPSLHLFPPNLIPRNSRKSPDPGTQGTQSDPVHNQEGHSVTMTGCGRGRKNTSTQQKTNSLCSPCASPDSLRWQIYERHPDQELCFEIRRSGAKYLACEALELSTAPNVTHWVCLNLFLGCRGCKEGLVWEETFGIYKLHNLVMDEPESKNINVKSIGSQRRRPYDTKQKGGITSSIQINHIWNISSQVMSRWRYL